MISDRRLAVGVGSDVFVVVAFVAIGRRNHDEQPGLTGVLDTAAPFLIALAVAWLIVRAWRGPTTVVTGVALWPVTVAAGMILRRTVFDGGTAAAFVVVATLFLGAGLVGWRLLWRAIERRREPAQASGGSLTAR
ncbi:MAG: DUF3054 domain-containing protein [Ilumatobacter sp.]|nr:DUF3054 domain-containing protein [Ilumatobacter sp.]